MINSDSSKQNTQSQNGVLSDDYAKERLKNPAHIFRLKVRAAIVSNTILNRFNSCDELQIVDFGAAEGLTMIEMLNFLPFASITGIEYSTDLIHLAPPFPDNLKLIKGDVTALKNLLPSEMADVVSSLALLEHLPFPEKAIKEAYSLLKEGGIFIASCPNPFWDKVACFFGLLKDGNHETDMTIEIMTKLLQKHKFKDIKFEKFMWAPTSFLPYLHIPISTEQSARADLLFQSVPLANLLFVNQLIVGTK